MILSNNKIHIVNKMHDNTSDCAYALDFLFPKSSPCCTPDAQVPPAVVNA